MLQKVGTQPHVEHSKHMTIMGKSFGVWPTRSNFTDNQHAFVTSAPGSHYAFNPINVYPKCI